MYFEFRIYNGIMTYFLSLLIVTSVSKWGLLYVALQANAKVQTFDLLSFLLRHTFWNLQAYSVNSLPPVLQKVLEELAALGLVQLQKVTNLTKNVLYILLCLLQIHSGFAMLFFFEGFDDRVFE